MKLPDPVNYIGWIEREISDKPADARAFLRRVYRAGVGALAHLAGATKRSLSLSAYADGKQGKLYRMYESLLRDAASDPDRFIYTLPRELEEIAGAVREGSLYAELLALSSLASAVRQARIADGDEAGAEAASSYLELIKATCFYLAPSEYDISHLLCGRSAEGEPLYCDLYYPYAGEVRALALQDNPEWDDSDRLLTPGERIERYAKLYGYGDIRTENRLTGILDADDLRTENILGLSPFLCEYTWDMLPDTEHVYRGETGAFKRIGAQLNFRTVTDSLSARSRTLPPNGVRYDFSYSPQIPAGNRLESLLLKEVSRRDRIVALYRLRFSGQDVCGYYDLKEPFFFSPFAARKDRTSQSVHGTIYLIVSYLYGAAVTPDGEQMVRRFGEHFYSAAYYKEGIIRHPVTVTCCPLEGELRDTYENGGADEPGDLPPEDGDSDPVIRTLQGYIRKLGEGEAPSEVNRARARELGFALAEDEAYEEPFL